MALTSERVLLVSGIILYASTILLALLLTDLPQVYIVIVSAVLVIQLITHAVLTAFGGKCRPNENTALSKSCNSTALLLGITHVAICIRVILTFKPLAIVPATIALMIALYMTFSHIITIKPLMKQRELVTRSNINLDATDKRSYLLMGSNAVHERKLRSFLESPAIKAIWQNKAIIDAGAYIGDFSIFFAAEHYPSHVYAIEPSKSNVAFIQKVISANRNHTALSTHLHVIHGILSHSDNIPMSITNDRQEDEPNAKYSMASSDSQQLLSVTLDTLVSNGTIVGPVGLLHFDVEGMELDVLKGAIQTILKYRPVIVVEILGSSADNTHEDLFYFMYETVKYAEHHVVDESCAFGDVLDRKQCRNIVFLP